LTECSSVRRPIEALTGSPSMMAGKGEIPEGLKLLFSEYSFSIFGKYAEAY